MDTAHTGVSRKVYVFKWVIENFKDVARSPTLLEAQRITVITPLENRNEFKINLSSCYNTNISDIKISFYPQVLDEGSQVTPDYYYCFEVTLPNYEDAGQRLPFFKALTDLKQNKYSAELKNFIRGAQLIGLPVVNGSLVIHLKLYVFTPKRRQIQNLQLFPAPLAEDSNMIVNPSLDSEQQLLKDFQALFKSPRETRDVKIVTSDKREFPVHKTVLVARSTVFASMFRSDFTEQIKGIVEISDVSSKLMEIMLEYVYTGNMSAAKELDTTELTDLAYAAEKYDLKYLHEFCDLAMAEKCDANNALSLIVSAEKFNLKFTKTVVLKFMKSKLRDVTDVGMITYLYGMLE